MGVRGYFVKKAEALRAEINERTEAATSSYSAKVDFLQYIYSVLVAKNHYKIRLWCLYFSTILIMFTEQLCCRKVLCGCFRFIWLWQLIPIIKRGAERCALHLYCTYLIELIFADFMDYGNL